MQLPRHFLPRPPMSLDKETIASFERLYGAMLAQGLGAEVGYDLDAPKWQFLCYLTDTKGLLIHGSGNAQIEEFEPRKSNDSTEFGNRRAVYAASDGIWAMFFAIVDRHGGPSATMNAAFQVIEADGTKGQHYYFFSLDRATFERKPWQQGTMYLLARDGFEQEPRELYRSVTIESAHWASLSAVRPLGKLTIQPEDFPFLAQIVPHDQEVISERALEDPDGFPWLDE